MPFKRVLLAALTLLAALLLGLPWWIGRDMEQRYRAAADDAGVAGAPAIVSVQAFERGWFTSRARLRLEPATAPAAALFRALGATPREPSLVLENRIVHGPLPLAASGAGRWQPALAVGEGELRTGAAADAVASLSYRVRPLGGLELTLRSAGTASRQAAPAWRGLRLHASLPARHGPARLAIDAERLALPVAGARLVADGLRGRLDLSIPATGLPTGTAGVVFAALALSAPGDERELARATQIELNAELARDNDTLGFRATGTLTRVGSPRATYGPGELLFSVTDLDAGALTRLVASAVKLAGQGLSERALNMALAGALLAEAPRLLAHGPAAELARMDLATPEGRLTARGRLALESAKPVVLNNPFLLQRAVAGHLKLEIPPVAARHGALLYLRRHGKLSAWGSPEAWLAEQVSRGRLTRGGDDYAVSMTLADGRLLVNGRHPRALRP